MEGSEKCFACDRPLGKRPKLVDTRDGQKVFIGASCFRLIEQSGDTGYQPPRGGPKLYLIGFGAPGTDGHHERACLCEATPCFCQCHQPEPRHAAE